ncbi:biotin transport system ATP-binding protein [Pseudoxanthobacter soli DSM 19599]|uniref:Biotin transport system ATP-binding protein n=1 Tax=Pseudoxanthobacter soli DSM 19599 TaxID=1123029 RepID=A0A1M7ZDB0_9HYPH|nr:ABC transporter ATP-binding protein [Pseudoxanthobacter soli]SHO62789.1 biotin transport system ATP-binding protein [Pseudoxanthobacter soli DSM 19599]
MIRVEHVSHSFGDRPVLDGVDLSLDERRIAVVGSNGSGKSTFARLLNGLVLPARGRVLVDGLDTRADGKAVRRKVGFVFQNPDNQIVFPVVEEDLAFGLKNRGLSKPEIAARVDAALDRWNLTALRQQPAHLLSGGEKQLLAISGVLVMEPDYLVLDEPTTLLDLRNKRRIAEAIASLPQPVVVVTHDLDLVAEFDRVVVIEGGRVAVDDAPSPALARYVGMMS